MLSLKAFVSLLLLQSAQDSGRVRANQQEINLPFRLQMQNHKEPLENEKFK